MHTQHNVYKLPMVYKVRRIIWLYLGNMSSNIMNQVTVNIENVFISRILIICILGSKIIQALVCNWLSFERFISIDKNYQFYQKYYQELVLINSIWQTYLCGLCQTQVTPTKQKYVNYSMV